MPCGHASRIQGLGFDAVEVYSELPRSIVRQNAATGVDYLGSRYTCLDCLQQLLLSCC